MRGLIVDLFAGGGGASVGIEAALGRPVDVAINHDAIALAVHKANHPETRHLTADIWEVRPLEATGGRPVDLLWASPDCTHFSVAKGGKPRKQNIRSLAWAVVRWAAAVRPRIIALENVAEFRGWGPLTKDGKPDKKRMGETFRRWRRKLEALGYVVDYRVLDASHYGAPTRRRRLFLVARRDGQSIRWPEPTHGPGRLPYRTAAECIDWTLPCPSIFERERPLADKTMWRIAQGIKRFVLENPQPFVVGVGGRAGDSGPTAAGAPVGTITAKNDRAVVAPTLIKVNHGKDEARGEAIDDPLTTVTAKRRGHALVTPVLATIDQQGSRLASTAPEAPLPTTTTKNRHAVVAPTLIQTGYGERKGQRARVPGLGVPLGTMVNGQKHGLVSAFLATHYGGEVGIPADRPASTITATDHHGLVAATLATFRGTDPSQPGSASVEEPLPVVSAGGVHVAEVRAFLTAYYGSDGTEGQGQQLLEPMRTLTTRHRLGLVVIEGTEYQIVDIGMRMLQPHELKAAQFGRFAAAYDLSAAKTKSAQVRLIGNSVCPEVAEALIRANAQHLDAENVA
jgi:DNA (cytosine-5)-methyltransferase 1